MNVSSGSVLVLVCAIATLLFVWPRVARAQQGLDAQVIAQLRKAGSNLAKPHQIEFFLYVATREAAERLASKVRQLHFDVKVEPAAKGSDWLVLATKSLVPAESELVRLRTTFGELAAAENGTYDGWGTEVVK
jgi:hypothetical protein